MDMNMLIIKKYYCCPTKCLKALSSLHDLTPTPLQRRGARTLNQ